MKLKTAIYYASMFLGLDEVSELIESGEVGDEEQEKEKAILLRCANLVVSEIASDWIPLKTRESINSLFCSTGHRSCLFRLFSAEAFGKSFRPALSVWIPAPHQIQPHLLGTPHISYSL